jgi:hypothetical protein
MKITAAAIICLLITVGTWVYVHAQTNAPAPFSLPAGANGRYQVVAADIDFTNALGGTLKYKTTIRIDTQTGQTWALSELKDDKTGIIRFVWTKLAEDKTTVIGAP